MLYIVKKWDAGIRGTCWGGDGVGGVWCGAGGWLVVAWRIFTVLHLDIFLHRHLPTWTLEINLRQISCSLKCDLEFLLEEMSFGQNVFSMKCHVFLHLNVEQMK